MASFWISVVGSSHILCFFLSLSPSIGIELRQMHIRNFNSMTEEEGGDHSQKTFLCVPVIWFKVILVLILGLHRKIEDITSLLNIPSRFNCVFRFGLWATGCMCSDTHVIQ